MFVRWCLFGFNIHITVGFNIQLHGHCRTTDRDVIMEKKSQHLQKPRGRQCVYCFFPQRTAPRDKESQKSKFNGGGGEVRGRAGVQGYGLPGRRRLSAVNGNLYVETELFPACDEQ